MLNELSQRLRMMPRKWLVVAGCVVAGGAVAGTALVQSFTTPEVHSEISSQSRRSADRYTPSASEWASLTIEPVSDFSFRAEHVTEGKIAIDEDRSTPVFSPYAGRVTKLLARAGDHVQQGQPLFTIEAPDTVQAQNDFIVASTALNKAKSQLELAQLQDKRARDLFEGKAVPLKDYQQAQTTLIGAQNDMQSATTALEAARNRLRILGLTEAAIAAFQDKGKINPETTIYAPIAGTVVQRKIGPGQYVNAGASDPVFVIGDLSTVWLTAFVRESEAAAVEIGQDVSFKVLALPNRTLTARVNYVATAIDPNTRRLMVRATLDNPDGALKPEMFANVTIYSASDHPAVGVPRTALIYEGDQVRVWVARDDRSIELRTIKPGLTAGNLVEVIGNLKPGEKIVTKGSLFIDRAATG
ncbi:efflux RND transporter periplasmic adaptor subunit [Rhodopseudomonas sp. HC1]|uniref:efflux RND transporter periplasmic adaptor subunit n=1 Tax=Rhodopseudomonas infernalis TaxID=2897386 RepID=UPI001EE83797|nr:efflux RND transporter periplasmic adaptor subunit [Rhodopseudomonas infernalis]MCG6203251.1 efflux RND transporter periplasmic adaptor subunit [Rhodopseudomonas infernalis]